MAQPIGTHFFEGELGVVQLEFDGADLGLTTEDTEIEFVEDIKDILFQQKGTQPYDKIPTGSAYRIKAKFGQINNTLLEKLLRGVTKSGIGGKSLKLGRDIYRSGRVNFAKELILYRVDSEGDESTDPYFKCTFYSAMPLEFDSMPFGADTQRGLTVTFYCFFDETKNAFGYTGYASSLGL